MFRDVEMNIRYRPLLHVRMQENDLKPLFAALMWYIQIVTCSFHFSTFSHKFTQQAL